MSTQISVITPAPLRQRYEDLRSYVLEGRRSLGADPHSMVLLCRQGLADWMHGWHEMIDPRPSPPSVVSEPPLPATPLWQQQLTVLLAQMTQNLSIL